MVSEDRICKIIAKALGVKDSDITLKTISSDIDDWDSLGHIAILMSLEKELGEEYKESEKLASSVSVKEIIDCINS